MYVDPELISKLPEVVKAIHEGVKAANTADEEYKAAVKDAEANVKDKAPLVALQKKLEERLAGEIKTVLEKKTAIKGILAGEALKKKGTTLEGEKLAEFSTYQDDKAWWKEFEDIAGKNIARKIEQAETDVKKKKAKDEEAMTKELWSLLERVGAQHGNLGIMHDQAISSMLSLQKKQTLVDLLSRSDDSLLPELISDVKAQRLFISFLKLVFSSAVLKKLQVGNKSELNKIKSLMKRVFTYSLTAEGHAGSFVKNFFENGCLKPAVGGVQAIRAEKPGAILDFYSNEDNALNGCNPYLLKYIVQWLLN